jgi:hypothetical protein
VLFRAGVTSCPRCGQALDSTDDVIAVDLEGDAPGMPPTGFYHPACFADLPSKEAYLDLFARRMRQYLDQQSRVWTILESGPRLAAAYVTDIDTVMIYFLRKARIVPLACVGPWQEFQEFLLETEIRQLFGRAGHHTALSRGGLFTLRVDRAQPAAILGVRNDVRKLVRFQASDMADLKRVRPDCALPGAEVDFAAACRAAGLRPVVVEGFLENCKGIIESVEPRGPQVTLRFVAEKWSSIPFSPLEWSELRRVLTSVG